MSTLEHRVSRLEEDVSAIKEDVRGLRESMAGMREDMINGFASLRVEMHKTQITQIKWMVSFMVGIAAVTLTIARLFF